MNNISYIENLNQWRSEFIFSVPIKIRFSETDMFGHVNNVSPFIYFEEARIEYLKAIELFDNVSNSKFIPIVADLQCDYHEQLYFDNNINVFVKTNQIGTTSFDLHYMVLNDHQKLCLTGRGRLVNIDKQTGKPAPLNDEMKMKLIRS